jgi:hypothetical protein
MVFWVVVMGCGVVVEWDGRKKRRGKRTVEKDIGVDVRGGGRGSRDF